MFISRVIFTRMLIFLEEYYNRNHAKLNAGIYEKSYSEFLTMNSLLIDSIYYMELPVYIRRVYPREKFTQELFEVFTNVNREHLASA